MALSASCARPFVRSPARLPNKISTDHSTDWWCGFCQPNPKTEILYIVTKNHQKLFHMYQKYMMPLRLYFEPIKKTLTTIYIRPGPIDWPKSLKKYIFKKISPETETTGPFLYANYVCRMLSKQTPARPTIQPIARLFDF